MNAPARAPWIDPRVTDRAKWLSDRAAPVRAHLESHGFEIERGHFPARTESGRWLWLYSKDGKRFAFKSDTAFVTELELTEMVVCPLPASKVYR